MSDDDKTPELPDDVKAKLAKLDQLQAEVDKIRKAGESNEFEAKLKANNGETAALARQQHAQIIDLQTQLSQAQAKIPGEGAVVLTGSKAREWAAYQELGKIDEIKSRLTQGEEATKKVATYDRNAMLTEVATLEGFKAGAFNRLAGDLKFEVKSEDIDGKAQKVAYVTGADGKQEKVADFATREWSDFMPSLKPESGSGSQEGKEAGQNLNVTRVLGTPLGGGHNSGNKAVLSADQEKAIANHATAAF